MEDFSALTAGERALLEALNRRGTPFLIVGLSAAVIQGANSSTCDIGLWFADTSDPRLGEAIREAKGIWISGTFGARPPQIGGDAIGDRLDVVTHMHGLGPFADEYAKAMEVRIDDIPVRVLPLERIVASKRASGRPKDLAALPALEEALAALRAKV
jgi:hypothetical protein